MVPTSINSFPEGIMNVHDATYVARFGWDGMSKLHPGAGLI